MKYKIIYADPPWSFKNKNTGGSMCSGADSHYPVMNVDQICSLPIDTITDENCVLFMWWIASQPVEALKVVEAWGFKLKTMTGFSWVKKTKHGKDAFGMGFWTRQGTENCLIATKGRIVRSCANIRNVVHAPLQQHSRKPDEVRARITDLMGDIPAIELFARYKTDPHWHYWGNQIESDITLCRISGTMQGS